MIPRYNRNISERAKEAKLVEIRARVSVGDSTKKGVRAKVADFVQRMSCMRKNK